MRGRRTGIVIAHDYHALSGPGYIGNTWSLDRIVQCSLNLFFNRWDLRRLFGPTHQHQIPLGKLDGETRLAVGYSYFCHDTSFHSSSLTMFASDSTVPGHPLNLRLMLTLDRSHAETADDVLL